MIEFFGSAVFNEMVGKAEANDFGMQVVVCHIFKDCRTQSALNDAVFHSYYSVTLSCLLQDVLINGLEESHVVMCNRLPFFP